MHTRHAIGVFAAAAWLLAAAGCHDTTVDASRTALSAMPAPAASQVARGHYLAQAGDCEFCHTKGGGRPFAGGRAVPTPFGQIYSVNITPDPQTGIGRWTEQDFYRAMHSGIRKDGSHLYPAFPYPWFTKVSRADVDAIYAYLATVKPVRQAPTPNQLPWYLRWRGAVAGWNLVNFHEGEYRPDPQHSADWNRGAYLAQGLGHCSACHTPKNILGGSKRSRDYQGGTAGMHWAAPALGNDLRDGVGAWSRDDIVEYLQTGSNANSASAGPMTDVVMNSTQYLHRDDLAAIAEFLKVRPESTGKSTSSQGRPDAAAFARGLALYTDNCTACHMSDGRGQGAVFPPLRGSSAVQADKPGTVIHVVLAGARMAAPAAKPTGLAMPAFAWKLDDRGVADVVNYIRNAWGNHASLVDPGIVKAVRKDMTAEYSPARGRITQHPDRPLRRAGK